MNPTAILKSEHRVIEQVLNCLEVMASRAGAEGTLDVEPARQAIDFFRTFADRCHHGKEEDHLFPRLEAKGLPRQGGPTGVMLSEHEQGRQYLRGMSEALDLGSPTQFAAQAGGYVALLRQHIAKEDQVLFRIADEVLTEQDQQNLLAAFQHVEDHEMHRGTHEKYLQIANALVDRFGVPHAQEASGGGHGCGSCGCHHHG